MSNLSDLRVTIHSTYQLSTDGTTGELLYESEPRYSNEVQRVSYSSVDEALASLNDVEEGEIVEEEEQGDVPGVLLAGELAPEPEAFESVGEDQGEVGEQISE